MSTDHIDTVVIPDVTASDVIPTRDQIADEVRSLLPGMTLYRPSPDWWKFEFSAIEYWMPPDLPGAPKVPHPVTGKNVRANGRILVKDRYGIYYDPKTRRPIGRGPMKGEDTWSIVVHALQKWGPSGLVLLRGDDHDAPRIAQAHKKYRQSMRTWAEAQREARVAFCENFKKQPQNKDRPIPPPSARQRIAQEILDEFKEDAAGTFMYACESGCYAGNDPVKFKRHLKANHPMEYREFMKSENAEDTGAVRASGGGKTEKLTSAAKKKTK